MITSRDIEITFVQAQNRINETIGGALLDFSMPDLAGQLSQMLSKVKTEPKQNENNPINNEVRLWH